jgi:phage shock protein PspC (stress-responsive transcriptional regulator)
MTTTDSFAMTPPPAPSPTPRRLRRSRSDRIGAGVAGGLGEYFGVDPVLFRVLFATAAFFGGAGILGYLLAWAAIPDEGTERAAIDGWVTSLRARRVPFWLIITAGAFLFWLIAFSWWAPGPFVPVIVVVIILVAAFGRRGRQGLAPSPAAPISLRKDDGTSPDSAAASSSTPVWVDETRTWMRDARENRRERLRRAQPVKIATLLTFVVAMVVLGLIDAAHGIALPLYFWFALGILGTGLLVGLALRRASWSVAILLVPTVIGLVAFAGTKVSLRDGIGQKQWQPTTTPNASYQLAFGQAVLDLTALPAQTAPSTVRIDVGAGQVKILAPKTMNVVVQANVHFGDIEIDGRSYLNGFHSSGVNVNRTIAAPATATGPAITVDIHLADGHVDVDHR